MLNFVIVRITESRVEVSKEFKFKVGSDFNLINNLLDV